MFQLENGGTGSNTAIVRFKTGSESGPETTPEVAEAVIAKDSRKKILLDKSIGFIKSLDLVEKAKAVKKAAITPVGRVAISGLLLTGASLKVGHNWGSDNKNPRTTGVSANVWQPPLDPKEKDETSIAGNIILNKITHMPPEAWIGNQGTELHIPCSKKTLDPKEINRYANLDGRDGQSASATFKLVSDGPNFANMRSYITYPKVALVDANNVLALAEFTRTEPYYYANPKHAKEVLEEIAPRWCPMNDGILTPAAAVEANIASNPSQATPPATPKAP